LVVYIKIRGANLILVPMPSVESKTMHQSLSWDSRSRSSKERLIFKSALISSSILRSYIFTDGQFNPVHVRLILLFQGPLACPCGGVTGLFCRKTTSTYTSGSINWLRNTRRRFWVCTLEPFPPLWSTTTTASDRCSPDPNSRADSSCPSLTCERKQEPGWVFSRQDKSKAITLQAWTGHDVSRSLRLPDFKPVGTSRW